MKNVSLTRKESDMLLIGKEKYLHQQKNTLQYTKGKKITR